MYIFNIYLYTYKSGMCMYMYRNIHIYDIVYIYIISYTYLYEIIYIRDITYIPVIYTHTLRYTIHVSTHLHSPHTNRDAPTI